MVLGLEEKADALDQTQGKKGWREVEEIVSRPWHLLVVLGEVILGQCDAYSMLMCSGGR